MKFVRRIRLVAILLLMSTVSAWSQARLNANYQNYILQYKDMAIQEMLRYNIPASITLAQAIFESGAGQSELARKGNNHFGIKCHDWTGRTVYHDDDEQNECFRAYDNAIQSFEDHSKFLASSQRYSSLFKLSRTDYKGWARGLKAAGYATNPTYAERLIELIELYQLYQYDKATSYATTPSGSRPTGNLHPIYTYNKNYYLYARRGDTFKSIGYEVGISYKKIARHNERSKNDVLQEGEVVFLKKKQKKADKMFRRTPHVVKPGESMYTISQMYGIRLKSLYKLNRLPADYQPRVGDQLRIR